MTEIAPQETTPQQAVETPPAASRRDLFGKAAIAAAVTTVAGLSMAKSAAAANGDVVNVGAAETGTATTSLGGGSTFLVTDGTSTGVTGTGAREGSIYGRTTLFQHVGVLGWASGTEGWGVYGKSSGTSGRGVYGLNTATGGVGVYGEHNNTSTSGNGVIGVSNFGVGVAGSGTTYDFHAQGSGKLLLAGTGVTNPPTGGVAGTIAKDSAGNLWVCVAPDTPGTWRKLAGPSTAGSLQLLASPKRVYSSRAADELAAVGTEDAAVGGHPHDRLHARLERRPRGAPPASC